MHKAFVVLWPTTNKGRHLEFEKFEDTDIHVQDRGKNGTNNGEYMHKTVFCLLSLPLCPDMFVACTPNPNL